MIIEEDGANYIVRVDHNDLKTK